ncbi:MAG TPA: sulfite exporter TauE/SafE family protein [Methylocystis sp.]|nr:sulfite exporter TauE/SafE family protein [Methylocystis sp.]
MEFLGHINLLYSLSGLLIGGLVGLTGVGGGSLMTPLLVLLFGVAPTTAVGTDLLYAAITKSNGTLVHGLNGAVDWRIVRRLAAGSIPATLLSLVLLWKLGGDSHGGANGLVTSVLGIALVLTGASILFRRAANRYISRYTDGLSDAQILKASIVLGATLGFLVTVSSVGAGAIGMSALVALYSRAPIVRLVGTDIAHAVPLTLLAGLGHWLLGDVDLALLASLLIGSLPGIAIASHFASKAPEQVLRPILASVMTVTGARLLG